MRTVLILLASMVLSSVAHAERVYTGNGVTIHFRDAECEHPAAAAALLGRGAVSPPKKAAITIGARYVAACWAHDKDGDYIVMDREANGVTVYARRVRDNGV